jgi:hypothetical protein
MVVGLILASLIRNNKRLQARLPSIRGKLETVHAIPGRLRLNSKLLAGLQAKPLEKISAEIEKIDGIERVDINSYTGSILIEYRTAIIGSFLVHGIVVKVLGLEADFEKSPSGWITREIDMIGRALNQQVYQSSGGLMDLNSTLMLSLFMLALYQMLIQGDRALPGGINLLWWMYVLGQKRR